MISRREFISLLPFASAGCVNRNHPMTAVNIVDFKTTPADAFVLAAVIDDRAKQRFNAFHSADVVYVINVSTEIVNSIKSMPMCSSLSLISTDQWQKKTTQDRRKMRNVRIMSINLKYNVMKNRCTVIIDEWVSPLAAENWSYECAKTSESHWKVIERLLLTVS